MNGPGETTRDLRLLLLSLAAGCVDAVAFVQAGVFPANMTGNSVVLALALLRIDVGGLAQPALALAGFCLGAAVAALLLSAAGRAWSRRVDLALFLSGALLLAAATAAAFPATRNLPALVFAAALAMGLQSAAVQQLGVPGIATVVVTGTLTTAVTRLVAALRGRTAGEPAAVAGPWLPALTWAAYFGGALLGGLQSSLPAPLLLWLPGALLAGMAIGAELARRRVARGL